MQVALNGNIAAGPTIKLEAGTFPSGTPGSPDYSPGHVGNIVLGQSGVIGGTINLTANGDILEQVFTPQLLNLSLLQTNQTLSVTIAGILTPQEITSLVLQTSTNLVDWTSTNLPISTDGNGVSSFQAPISSTSGCGFFRILSQ